MTDYHERCAFLLGYAYRAEMTPAEASIAIAKHFPARTFPTIGEIDAFCQGSIDASCGDTSRRDLIRYSSGASLAASVERAY